MTSPFGRGVGGDSRVPVQHRIPTTRTLQGRQQHLAISSPVTQDACTRKTYGGGPPRARRCGWPMNNAPYESSDGCWYGLRLKALGDQPHQASPSPRAVTCASRPFYTAVQNASADANSTQATWHEACHRAPKSSRTSPPEFRRRDLQHGHPSVWTHRLPDVSGSPRAYLIYTEANLRGGGRTARPGADVLNLLLELATGTPRRHHGAGLTLQFIPSRSAAAAPVGRPSPDRPSSSRRLHRRRLPVVVEGWQPAARNREQFDLYPPRLPTGPHPNLTPKRY